MFILKIVIILLSGGIIQATHDSTFPTKEACEAFAPAEIKRIGDKLNAKWPGTEIVGACEPGQRVLPGEPA